ncbi:MAG: hypothetical protein HY722_00030 [Planctomycetes bacterium]|nr:hypothetical protein [Planctomycetota bacterium]
MIAREMDLRGLVPLDSLRFEVDEEDVVQAVEGPLRRALLPIQDGLGRLERRLNRIESCLESGAYMAAAPGAVSPRRAGLASQGAISSGVPRRSDIFLRIVDENLTLRGRSLADSGVEVPSVARDIEVS